jgi:hypothetical protein
MVTGPAAPIAAPVAATIAGIGAYGLQQYGNFMSTQGLVNKAPEDLDTDQARTWAALTAPLGFIVDRFVGGIGSKFGQKAMMNKVTQEIAKRKAAGEGVTAAVTKEIGKATVKGVGRGISEMPTEMLEQAAEIHQAGGDLSTEESRSQIFEAGWAGLAVGSGIGGSSNAYSKYKEFQTELQKEQEQSEQREEDLSKGRPSRDTLIDETWKDLQSKAKPIEPEVEEAEVTTEPTTTLDKATLTSWGLNPKSNAFKALEGVDGSTDEGRDLINKTLEANKGKINESAVDDYLKGVESGRPITGTATVGDEILGGQVDGIAGGAQGRFGPSVDFSRSLAGLPETREEVSDDTLKPVKEPEAKATQSQGKARIMSVMELLNQPDLNLRYEARTRYIQKLKDDAAIEYSKYESKLRELAKKVSPTLPVVKQSNNLANVLTALKDPPRYLIEDLKNPNVIDTERRELNQQARDYITLSNLYDEYKVKMTPQEIETERLKQRTWDQYMTVKQALEAKITDGKTLRAHPELKAVLDNLAVTAFKDQSQAWYDQYQLAQSGDTSYKYARALQEITSDSKFMTKNGNSQFWKDAQTFIQSRAMFTQVYQALPDYDPRKAQLRDAYNIWVEANAGQWDGNLKTILTRYFDNDSLKAVN